MGKSRQQILPDELISYIADVSNEPFRSFTNNCLHRVLKVARKANGLGLPVEIYFAWAKTPRLFNIFYFFTPHFIPIINGIEIDVFYAPYWRIERIVKDRIKVTEHIYNTPYPNVTYIILTLLAILRKRCKYNMALVMLYAPLSLPVYFVTETFFLLLNRIRR